MIRRLSKVSSQLLIILEMNRLAEERLLLIRDLEKVLHYNEQQLQVKEEQLQNLIQSRSYKLGNLIIHNTKRTLFVLKDLSYY